MVLGMDLFDSKGALSGDGDMPTLCGLDGGGLLLGDERKGALCQRRFCVLRRRSVTDACLALEGERFCRWFRGLPPEQHPRSKGRDRSERPESPRGEGGTRFVVRFVIRTGSFGSGLWCRILAIALPYMIADIL